MSTSITPTRKAAVVAALQRWLNEDPLWEDSSQLEFLGIQPSVPEEVPAFHPSTTAINEIITLVDQHLQVPINDPQIETIPPNTMEVSVDQPDLPSTMETDSPLLTPLKEKEAPEAHLVNLLQTRSLYHRELGVWPQDASTLLATHMKPAEVIRSEHYHGTRTNALKHRATAMQTHKAKIRSIWLLKEDMERLVAEGEVHRLDALRASQDMSVLCDTVRTRPPLHSTSANHQAHPPIQAEMLAQMTPPGKRRHRHPHSRADPGRSEIPIKGRSGSQRRHKHPRHVRRAVS